MFFGIFISSTAWGIEENNGLVFFQSGVAVS
jgi:hypothetical protein